MPGTRTPSLPTDRPISAGRRNLRQLRLSRLGLLLILFGSGSCTGLRPKSPTSENVVAARQLSQQGLNALHQGRYADAEFRFREAISECPTNTTARYQLANCLWKRGAQQEAIDQLSEALEISGGTDIDMLVELGYMHANLSHLSEAYVLSEEAVRLAPDRADVWQLRADILREQGQFAGALAAYHRALSHDPTNVDVRLAAAEIHQQQGQPARALAAISHLEEQIPPGSRSPQFVMLKAQALRELSRSSEAESVLLEAVAQGISDTELMGELARVQVEAGHFAQARQTVEDALPLVDAETKEELRRLIAPVAQTGRSDGETKRR